MRRLIDEYGLAILYAIVGILCLFIFGWLFLGDDNDFSKVISNVVDKTTDSTSNITYDIEYDLNGGYYDIKRVQDGLTLRCNNPSDNFCRINKLSDILGFDGDDAEGQEENRKYKGAQKDVSGARYYELTNGSRLWITYTKDKSYVIPTPLHHLEDLSGKTYTIFFDGWTSSSLNIRTRNVIIPKGSTGTKKYTANWTKGKYKVTFEPGIEELKSLPKYATALSNGFNIYSLLSGDTSDILVEYSTGRVTFPANAYNFIGHKFKYWTDSVGNKYYPGTTYSISEPESVGIDSNSYISTNGLTYYAVWELETYKLNYVNWKATKANETSAGTQTSNDDKPQNFEETNINYTVLDDFDLEKATMPGFKNGEWYTVNPYLYNGNPGEINSKLFGSYSFMGDNTNAYFFGQYNELPNSDMLANKWIWSDTEHNYKKSNGSLVTSTVFKPQHVSYGTYGDIVLYSFFSQPETYQIKLYEKHYNYTIKNTNTKVQPSWIETETEPKLIGLIEFQFDSTIEDIFNFTLTTEKVKDYVKTSEDGNFKKCGTLYDTGLNACTDSEFATQEEKNFEEILNNVFKKTLNYEFEGFETENGNLVFAYTKAHEAANADKMAFAAVGEQSLYWSMYSTVEALENAGEGGEVTAVTNRYHWAYPENLTLYARWTPMTYIVKLHSNY